MDGESTGEIDQGGATEELPTLVGSEGFDQLGEPLLEGGDDEWPVRGPAGGVRLGLPAAALLAVVLVAAGFWGGSVVQKDHGGSSTTATGGLAAFASRLRGLGGGATGATGTTGATGSSGFGFGGASGATIGTISVVEGKLLYVLTTSGGLVKVTLDPSTTITRNANASAVGLRPGDTVVVQGAAAANGDVAATSVAATAPGVGSGGFGRGAGAGLGGSTSSAGSTTTNAG